MDCRLGGGPARHSRVGVDDRVRKSGRVRRKSGWVRDDGRRAGDRDPDLPWTYALALRAQRHTVSGVPRPADRGQFASPRRRSGALTT
jgi:hypothetical protein